MLMMVWLAKILHPLTPQLSERSEEESDREQRQQPRQRRQSGRKRSMSRERNVAKIRWGMEDMGHGLVFMILNVQVLLEVSSGGT